MAKKVVSWIFKIILILLITEVVVRILFRVQETPLESSYWREEKWISNHSRGINNKYIIDRYDSLLGWTLDKSLDSVDMGTWWVNSNSKGARGKKEYDTSGAKKIVFIGDSFTFGECVNDHQTIPFYLDEFLQQYDVINLGVHGYGNDQQLLKLKKEGFQYQPDIVILGLVEDDFVRNRMFFRDYAKPFFEVKDDTLVLKNTPIHAPENYSREFRWKTASLVKATSDVILSSLRYRQYFGFNDTLNDQRTLKIIEEIKKVSLQNHAKFYIVLIPSTHHLEKENPKYHYVVEELIKTEENFISSVHEVREFLNNSDNPEKHTACHFSPEINYLIAKKISASVQ